MKTHVDTFITFENKCKMKTDEHRWTREANKKSSSQNHIKNIHQKGWRILNKDK